MWMKLLYLRVSKSASHPNVKDLKSILVKSIDISVHISIKNNVKCTQKY